MVEVNEHTGQEENFDGSAPKPPVVAEVETTPIAQTIPPNGEKVGAVSNEMFSETSAAATTATQTLSGLVAPVVETLASAGAETVNAEIKKIAPVVAEIATPLVNAAAKTIADLAAGKSVSLNVKQATAAALSSIQVSIETLKDQTHKNATAQAAELQRFLTNITPTLTALIGMAAAGDPDALMNIRHLYGQTKAEVASFGLATLEIEQQQIAVAVNSVATTAIHFALAALITV